MEIIIYKTNIRNEAALHRVSLWLNKAVGPANWQLDINSSDKKLTVYSNSTINKSQVTAAIQKAGFKVMNLDDYFAVY